jgi:hypothetical protein
MMALLFAVNPLLYLKSEGRLPVPFMKKAIAAPAGGDWGQLRSAAPPPLLDAKGRAVPPDVAPSSPIWISRKRHKRHQMQFDSCSFVARNV